MRSLIKAVIILLGSISVLGQINQYEYWFDDGYSDRYIVPYTPSMHAQFSISVSTSSLQTGLHVFHIRFRDVEGNWSSVVSQFFYKPFLNGSSSQTGLTGYEYWLDQDYAGRTTGVFSGTPLYENLALPVATSLLSPGLHSFHIRFRDVQGNWSSVVSQFFYKVPLATTTPTSNVITAYRYWLDNEVASINTYLLNTPSTTLSVISNINLSSIPKGYHAIHFQFRDTLGNWSVTISDTFYKQPNPVADFILSDSTVCVGDTVQFFSRSIDADTWQWQLGDGNQSADTIVRHAYQTPGVYTVHLTVQDTASGRISTTGKNIYVTAYPSRSVYLNGNDTLCSGDNVLLSLQANQSVYVWNTGEQSAQINVSQSGNYFALITSIQNSSCFVYSDTVSIVVNPMPDIDLGNDTTLCPGQSLVLNGYYPQSTYIWSTQATSSTITVTQDGTYAVTVINSYQCAAVDSIQISTIPLPEAAFSYSIDQLTVFFFNESTNAVSYHWDFGDGTTANHTNPVHDFPAGGGQFLVRLIAINSCGADTIFKPITLIPVGVEEMSSDNFLFQVFPNPANDYIYLRIKGSESGAAALCVYDISGKRIIFQTLYHNRSEETIRLSVSHLPAGSYYAHLTSNHLSAVRKIIIYK